MKNIFFTIFLMTGMSCFIKAQNYQPFRQYDLLKYGGYQFTIVPGTEAWRNLDMNADKHALLQIPEDTLSVISTPRLVETCLYYPMNIEIFAFDNLTQGFAFVRTKFNGFDELFRREDAGICLLSYYQLRDPVFVTQFKEPIDQGRYSLDFVRLELMLAQPEIIDRLGEFQIRSLLRFSLGKIERQADFPQYYSRVFIPVTALVMGRILQKTDAWTEIASKSSVSKFIELGILESPEDISEIFRQAKIFINKNK
ncbi:MAG: hypothetical protein LBV02_06260 [Bacteroidales bacterium]|jgi:hypothetical protein|nr:hypothetical protein [Bacteroidales bacterium]